MFGWLFSKSKRDGFWPQEEPLFPYFNGQKWVYADPMRLLLEVRTDDNLGEVDLRLSAMTDRAGAEATKRIVAGVRRVFGIKEKEDGGLGPRECQRLLLHFWNWLEKKSAPTTSSSTPSKADLDSDDLTPVANSSESVSIATEQPPAAPAPSLSASPPPSGTPQTACS